MWQVLAQGGAAAEGAELPGQPVDGNICLEGISGELSKHRAPGESELCKRTERLREVHPRSDDGTAQD